MAASDVLPWMTCHARRHGLTATSISRAVPICDGEIQSFWCKKHPNFVKLTVFRTLPADPSNFEEAMNHPYSGAASYIYANDYPYTPTDPQDPYPTLQSFVPGESFESLPVSAPYSPSLPIHATATTPPQRSRYGGPRGRPESQQFLIPVRHHIAHPYQLQITSWAEDDDDGDGDAESLGGTTALSPNRLVQDVSQPTGLPKGKPRLGTFQYEPRPVEELERAKRAASWRRKIQRQIRRALRRLRRFLETL
ncbi:hypothetical protein B0H10DRAFT_505759 [Mycena sp. CBHHK59/15]|nr:hypothetical protein B0H10DRAFT_505759 [Mycena sp. CBHHK59/15]